MRTVALRRGFFQEAHRLASGSHQIHVKWVKGCLSSKKVHYYDEILSDHNTKNLESLLQGKNHNVLTYFLQQSSLYHFNLLYFVAICQILQCVSSDILYIFIFALFKFFSGKQGRKSYALKEYIFLFFLSLVLTHRSPVCTLILKTTSERPLECFISRNL